MGETAAVAERVAALMDVIGPYLTSSAVALLAHRTSARAVSTQYRNYRGTSSLIRTSPTMKPRNSSFLPGYGGA